ncbi:hypothetical protein AWB80_05842 [Caballeronia pedi]|uniref:Uncharacterized protein n=1 Tax=Caballeronia pedi TaxID=1777141 RepID=A0A158CV83_9BURK|nr:hypothetical protein [Caballeronia pedi]SAK85836.1 hypothetical protein AWB80_05842 [Caballeronia pedi]
MGILVSAVIFLVSAGYLVGASGPEPSTEVAPAFAPASSNAGSGAARPSTGRGD